MTGNNGHVLLIRWSAGITAPQAFDLAQRRVFGIFSTSSTAAKIAVTAQFQQDPRLAAENEPTEFGVRRMHAIIQGGFLSSRMRKSHEGLAREFWKCSPRTWLRAEARPAKSQAALETLNELLVRGWRHLVGPAEDTKSEVANRNLQRTAARTCGFGSEFPRPQECLRSAADIHRTPRTAFHAVYSPDATPIWTDGVPSRRAAGVKGKHDPRRGCRGLLTAPRSATTKRKEQSAAERIVNYMSLVFDMPASRSGFPESLAADEITPDQPYHLFERSIDWYRPAILACRGTRKANPTSAAFLAGVAKAARQVQADPRSLDAAIFSATGDWVLWWDHSPTPVATGPAHHFDAVANLMHASAARRLRVPASLLEPYAGLSLNAQTDFVNLQFPRK